MSESSPEPPRRRVLALVLPALLVELAEARLLPETLGVNRKRNNRKEKPELRRPPLAVVRVDQCTLEAEVGRAVERELELPGMASSATPKPSEVSLQAVLSAVNDSARRFGVCEGQTLAEARALLANLRVHEVTQRELSTLLGQIAEVGLGFGATVAFEAPDTVWVDVTGSAHLKGGEEALASELVNRVRGMGHMARIAIADGPELARAFARFSSPSLDPTGVCVVATERTVSAFAALPVRALALDPDTSLWLARLGILTVGELAALPRASLGARLGAQAGRVLELCAGRDSAPLNRHVPPRTLLEESSWDEPAPGIEPLLFVLRGLSARLSARLEGRGEAAQSLVLRLIYDPALARFHAQKPTHVLRFKFAVPVQREQALYRIIVARLERVKLGAPTLGIALEVTQLTPALTRQLEFSQLVSGAGTTSEDELPVLLAELTEDIGPERIGVLTLIDAHRPESRSVLEPVLAASAKGSAARSARLRKAAILPHTPSVELGFTPTRLLPNPVELCAPLRVGATIIIERGMYTIERLHFEQRLETVEWWKHVARESSASGSAPVSSPAPGPAARRPRHVARDYVRLWLSGAAGGFEALAYVDRCTGKRYLQGVAD